MSRNIILVDPLPRTLDLIMEPNVRARLDALGEVVISRTAPDDGRAGRGTAAGHGADLRPDVHAERAARPRAKAEGDRQRRNQLLPNIDYQTCTERGIWVITPGSAFAAPVAESALGMAIDLCRNITAADRQFRAGTEGWGLGGNDGRVPLCRSAGRHRRLRRSRPPVPRPGATVPQCRARLRSLAARPDHRARRLHSCRPRHRLPRKPGGADVCERDQRERRLHQEATTST